MTQPDDSADPSDMQRRLSSLQEAMRALLEHWLSTSIPGGEPVHRLVRERFERILGDQAIRDLCVSADASHAATGVLVLSIFKELLTAWRMLGQATEDVVTARAALAGSSEPNDDSPAPPSLH